ncbi:MAG: hypothetical protein U0528_09985 [Anaerolineae bacterium]
MRNLIRLTILTLALLPAVGESRIQAAASGLYLGGLAARRSGQALC